MSNYLFLLLYIAAGVAYVFILRTGIFREIRIKYGRMAGSTFLLIGIPLLPPIMFFTALLGAGLGIYEQCIQGCFIFLCDIWNEVVRDKTYEYEQRCSNIGKGIQRKNSLSNYEKQ